MSLDMDYLYSLSADAQNVIFEEGPALSQEDTVPQDTVPQESVPQGTFEDTEANNDYNVASYRAGNWKMYNVSREKLTQYLSKCP